ncbi:uncharacterized protein LTR77_004815 [Saxophila tyrrhenica]|uniref:Uncharacterized protein n=1 Tax=Saxophila tyrrhenica TaxID=1690608 RepID=A0AAV9PAH3_9PEZI|nr:hypothetical protein LTR77_004815 [Saxophila tyrrhenica]
MSTQTLLRTLTALTTINLALSGTIHYNTNSKLERNHEEAEARADEIEGTLRGHIGLIEESLERLEGKGGGGWGQGMGQKTEEMYSSRGRDGK